MAMVSSLMGPINSLLVKLPARPEFRDLRDGLLSIRKDLLGFCTPGAVRSLLVRRWMKQVREVAYDIEDWIDDLLNIRSASQPELGSSYDVAAQIGEFMVQIHDAQDRCARYGLLKKSLPSDDDDAADIKPSKFTMDTKLLWEEKLGFVGLDGPKSELRQHLTDDKEKRLKVVSIVGLRGLGKTTLATTVYQELQSQFECRAFTYVGRNPSTRTTLANILRQVMPWYEERFGNSWDEEQVITELWEFLHGKRYLIVIDDIWSVRAWSSINCALPDNNLGSRILVTTCIDDVAKSCCLQSNDFVYYMKALSDLDSKSLILKGITDQEEDWTLDPNIYEILLRICSGMPLAILVAFGLLALKRAEMSECQMFEKAIISIQKQDSMTQGMIKILDISYADLPLPMKSCFLSLSTYPENHTIEKDRLIRRWLVEGFIPKVHGISSWATGERYFFELINRRLVKPVFNLEDDAPVGCTVLGVIHDFINLLSSEENFVTVGTELSSGPFPCDRIRRFSVHCTEENNGDILDSSIVNLSGVRSFTFYGDVKGKPDLSSFKLIQVLDLKGSTNLFYHLASIECLSLLRYLGLAGTSVNVLPNNIVELKHLTTLDFRQNPVRYLPAFKSVKLVSLHADDAELSSAMRKMPELEELSIIKVFNMDSMETVAELVKSSTRMRMLGVTFCGLAGRTERQRVMHYFLDIVGKSSLESLYLQCGSSILDLLLDGWTHRRPRYMRKFELRFSEHYSLMEVPQKMTSLTDLTHLRIRVKYLATEGLLILGNLPNLVLLTLTITYTNTEERIVVISKDSFQSLELFSFDCPGKMFLQFESGSMHRLRRLHVKFKAWAINGSFDAGIQHLSNLVLVRFTVGCQGARGSDVKAAMAAIQDQLSRMGNNAVWEICREGEEDSTMEDKGRQRPSRSGTGHFPETRYRSSRPGRPDNKG